MKPHMRISGQVRAIYTLVLCRSVGPNSQCADLEHQGLIHSAVYTHVGEAHHSSTLKNLHPLGMVFPLGTARTSTDIETYPKMR